MVNYLLERNKLTMINKELANLNIDIIAKIGIPKSTVNAIHKMKVKTVGNLADIEVCKLQEVIEKDGKISYEELMNILSQDLVKFIATLFEFLKEDSVYTMTLFHIKNHTMQELASKYGVSKDKVIQNIDRFLKSLFTVVDALGAKMIENKPYIALEDFENVLNDSDDRSLLILAFKAHNTKWKYHVQAECFTVIK